MARFMVRMQRTASATLDVGSVLTAAASPRRFKLYDVVVGSEAAPGDFAFVWEISNGVAAATPTAGALVAVTATLHCDEL
jgi:hypothetical protein